MNITEETLKNKIEQLKAEVIQYEEELFILRLYKLISLSKEDVNNAGISNIKITSSENELSIRYVHHTNYYDENNYVNNSDSNIETEPYEKNTTIEFGVVLIPDKNPKYYLKGNKSARFKIYRKSSKILSIINKDYNIELDIMEQIALIERYSKNKNIPEWLALKVFLSIRENEWDDTSVINYFSVV